MVSGKRLSDSELGQEPGLDQSNRGQTNSNASTMGV